MAPINKSNDSLMFLFICLLNLKDNNIDYNLVSAATNLKPSAVRMRWSRLKKQLEGDLVEGKFDLTKNNADNTEATEAAAAPVMTAASSAVAPSAITAAAASTTTASAPATKKKRGVKRKKIAAEENGTEK